VLAAAAPVAAGDVIAAFALDEAVRRAVLGLKYRNRRRLAGWFACRLAVALGSHDCDVVTWAPTSPARQRRRGYDQAELLARALARELGVPCRRLLRRVPGEHQTGRSRAERLTGPGFRAFLRRPRLHVLVVDDVVTTGATLAAARSALLAAGAGHVRLAAVAATPRHVPAHRRGQTVEGSAFPAPVGS
jgi:predicted amidophosphoribosyltransferase